MIIFNPDRTVVFNGNVTDQSYRYKSLMGDNHLYLYIKADSHLELPIGSYVYFQRDGASSGEYYFLLKPQNLIKNNTQNFDYTVIMESQQYLLRTQRFKYFTVDSNGHRDSKYKLKGWFAATAREFLELIVRVMNETDSGWTIGSCIESEKKNLEYTTENCLEFLQKLATEYKTEWSVVGKKISIGKVEYLQDSPLPLSYGYDNGLKSGVKRDVGDSERINRLYIIGGERNIYKPDYGNDTLLFAKNYRIKYDGRFFEDELGFDVNKATEYVTDSEGMYIQESKLPSTDRILEGVLDEVDIYPMRESNVSSVVTINDEKALYDIIDTSIPEDLNYNEYFIPQVKPTIVFHSGMLSGREFEINKYDHEARRFELVPIEDGGIVIPKGEFIPTVGDKYVLFNIALPQSYIDDAELRMLKVAVKYFYEESKQKFLISGDLDGIYAQRHWLELKDKLDVGFFVSFSDPQFFTETQDIRIVGIKDYINTPKKPTLELSNEVRVNSWSNLKADIRDSETITEKTNTNTVAFTKRLWRDLKQTQEMMYDPEGDFFNEFIKPLYIQTMQLVAGTESLQFMFVTVDDHEIASDLPNPIYNNVDKSISFESRALKHLTLGIDSLTPASNRTYKIWDIQSETLILESETAYYIYAKCEKDGTNGQYVASSEPIGTEDVAGYYYFWIGISNSEYDGERSWRTMYGFTEILAGQITVDKILTANGLSFINLIANHLCFTNGLTGDDEETLEYQDGKLFVTNATVKNSLRVDGSATIAGFRFYNDRIESVKTVMFNGEVSPALKIIGNSFQALIELKSVIERWSEDNTKELTLQTITIDSATGEILSRTSEQDISKISSQGIYSNRAGLRAVAGSTGVDMKAAITGLGYGTMNQNSWNNGDCIIGVYGRAFNASLNPTPAYGGWFDVLRYNGLALGTRIISGASSTTNLHRSDSFVLANSSNRQDIYLPADALNGTRVEIRQHGTGFIRLFPSDFQSLYDDETTNTHLDILNGQLAILTYIKVVSETSNGYWLLNRVLW